MQNNYNINQRKMAYKYFKYPSRYAVLTDEPIACEICKKKQICLDATAFYSKDEIEAICENCLKAGRLPEIEACSNDADVEELFDQLIHLHPNKKRETLLQEAKAKTDELEFRTPPLVSWQDWKFPALDGDYAQFVCFGSKHEYNKYAPDGDGKAFFEKWLLDDLREFTNFENLWRAVPENRIRTVSQSNDFSLLTYLFKSLHSEQYVIVWDLM